MDFRKISLTLVAFALPGILACGSRNLHKNTDLSKAGGSPIERTFVKTSHPENPDAGVERVEFGAAVSTADAVFTANEVEGVAAFFRSNFAKKWTFRVKNGVSSALLLAEDGAGGHTLFFGANDGYFYALDAEFGRILWRYETKLPVYAKPTLAGGKIYFTTSDEVVFCLDQNSGKWFWHYKRTHNIGTSIRGNSSPTIDGKHIIVGFSDGYVVALGAKDGNLVWERKIHSGKRFMDVDASAVADGSTLFMPSYDGGLYALDRTTGKILWKVDAGSAKKVLLDPRDSKSLYVAASDGTVVALNRSSGRILWKFELDAGTPTELVLKDNYLAFGSSVQYFYVIHKGDGSLAYRHNVGLRSGFVSNPFQSENELFLMSNFGNLYVFRWVKKNG
ncbi:MAG TPA: PQQ-binding-like beta-propeller repeat protein [Oligoflexia bacterium]|nr:PQQ-binding-like beta-propeller repeat protein [Oligoflexia bacterium]